MHYRMEAHYFKMARVKIARVHYHHIRLVSLANLGCMDPYMQCSSQIACTILGVHEVVMIECHPASSYNSAENYSWLKLCIPRKPAQSLEDIC